MKILIFFMVFFAGLPFYTSVLADTVTLKSGQKIEGKIVERTDQYVKIDFQGVVLEYLQEEVDSVIGDSKQPNPSVEARVKPAYAPIDFTGLAKHYPISSEGSASQEPAIDDFAINPYEITSEPQSNYPQPTGLSMPVDLSTATANLPPQYQEMINSIQSNPGDISKALSGLPPEYQKMVEEAMKNMPQGASSAAAGKKE
ncbi:MAG: hypothetical protein WC293_02350 [Candidatus Omnitrophota bacterium]|jgi:hypothetical protein